MEILQVANSDIDSERLIREIESELKRKIESGEISTAEVERVKNAQLTITEDAGGEMPHSLAYLMANKETYRGLPGRTHRGLIGRLAILAKKTFRRIFQVFINETLDPQVMFNDYLVDYLYSTQDRLTALERWNKYERGLMAETTEKRLAVMEKKHREEIGKLQRELAALKGGTEERED